MNRRPTIVGFLAGIVAATVIGLAVVVPLLRESWRANFDSDVHRGIQGALVHVEESAAKGDCEKAAAQLRVFNDRFAHYRDGGPPPADWYQDVIATTAPPDSPADVALGLEGDLVIRDHSGNVVATGKLRLPTTMPMVGKEFEGGWSLASSSPTFPAGTSQSGRYTGYVLEGGISCDLAPGIADANVVLSGALQGERFSGKWFFTTDAGDEELGTFVATWPADDAR